MAAVSNTPITFSSSLFAGPKTEESSMPFLQLSFSTHESAVQFQQSVNEAVS
jgi:hypothetical protein